MQQPIPVVFKKATSRFCKGCRIAALPLLLLRIAMVVMYSSGIELYMLDIPHSFWAFVLDLLLLTALAGSIWLGRSKRSLPFFIIAFLIAVIYAANLFPHLREYNEQIYISPSQNSTLVVRTKGYMFSGRICYFEKKSVLLQDTKECLLLDDGFQSLGNATVQAEWSQDESLVVFTYVDSKTGEMILKKEVTLKG